MVDCYCLWKRFWTTCFVFQCPAASGPPWSASQPGSSRPPESSSKHPTASPSPAAHHSASPAQEPAPPAWCTWSSASQGSGIKQDLDEVSSPLSFWYETRKICLCKIVMAKFGSCESKKQCSTIMRKIVHTFFFIVKELLYEQKHNNIWLSQ